jgi:hypothetical protein
MAVLRTILVAPWDSSLMAGGVVSRARAARTRPIFYRWRALGGLRGDPLANPL